MKPFAFFSMAFLAAAVSGQAIVEHSIITAGGAGAAAGGTKGAGAAIGGVFGNLNQVLTKAGEPGSKALGTANAVGTAKRTADGAEILIISAPSRSEKPIAPAKPVNPSEVTAGLGRGDLIARFGEPLLTTTDTTNSQLVERMWYPGITSGEVEIKLVGGKVASVQPPPDKQQDTKH